MYRLGCSAAVGGLYLAPWLHVWFSYGIPKITKVVLP